MQEFIGTIWFEDLGSKKKSKMSDVERKYPREGCLG